MRAASKTMRAASKLVGSAGREALGDAVSRRLWRLESETLCAEARRRTGLADFGEPPIEPALSILLDSLEREANLHPLGRFLMWMHLRGLLETRLRLAELWNQEAAALAASPLSKPVFITGMPRSGSTLLHELLGEDPANRAPRVWEVMFPVPTPASGRGGQDRRIRKSAVCLWWFRRLAPRSESVHPLRASTPHECVAIQSYTLLSEEFISTCRVPAYEAFLRATDLGPAYAWQRRFLQHLQWNCPIRRWVLKSPDHVFGLAKLFSAFPDARIIQTHRNPLEVLKSLNRLNEVLRGVFVRPGDPVQSEAREAHELASNMERLIRFRDAHPELASRFVDVNYSELVSYPLPTVRRIYEQLDIPLTQEAAERMRRLAGNRSRYRGRRRGPAVGDSRLGAIAEARRFERYCSRFGLSCEPAKLD